MLLDDLKVEEKVKLFNGNGNWHTFDADGKVPYFSMSDGPHGLRKQEEGKKANINDSNLATCFPTASCIASSWDVRALKLLGKSIALEAQSENVNMVLGCGINIKRSPLCGRNFEYYSEDPLLAGQLACGFVEGLQKEGVGSCVKHFACNNQEHRRQTTSSIVDERTLHEIYLRAFEIVVKNAKPTSIMASYNKINGTYTTENKKFLKDILRDKWGYEGAVISDWGACLNPVKSVKAGLDLSMPDSYGFSDKALLDAIESGELKESELEAANTRIVELAQKLSTSHRDVRIDYIAQHETALKLAEESAVLLKNRGLLPLKTKKVIVIGDFAENVRIQGGGSSHVASGCFPNLIQALQLKGLEVIYDSDLKKIMAEVQLAAYKNAPIIFCCGLPDAYEGEGFDRKDLKLPAAQIELLNQIAQITRNIIIVSFSGSPIDFEFEDKVNAILHMYLAGEASAEACANILTGKTNPSGHLAETFPMKIEDTPCYGNFAVDGNSVNYREGVFVGYRHYDTYDVPVRYEFGYGLSYTTFEFSDLDVKLPKVSLKVKNTGEVAGAEVVQIYVQNPQDEPDEDDDEFRQIRPKKELAGFEKVYLNPGEEKVIEIELDDKAFCVYSVKTQQFEKVTGEYKILAGNSSKNIKLSQDVSIKGKDIDDMFDEKLALELQQFKPVVPHKKGNFDLYDSLEDLSKHSFIVKIIMECLCLGVRLMNRGKSKDDPSVRIAIAGIKESPLVGLISISGGSFKPELAEFILKMVN